MKLESIKEGTYTGDIAKTLVKNAEGFSPTIYQDTLGNDTIGYGFTLKTIISMGYVMPYDKIMPIPEADFILERLLKNIYNLINMNENLRINFAKQCPTVQAVFADMIYNLGFNGFTGFTTFLSYMDALQYDNAVIDLTNTLWYSQVKQRAIRNCFIILSHSSSLYLI